MLWDHHLRLVFDGFDRVKSFSFSLSSHPLIRFNYHSHSISIAIVLSISISVLLLASILPLVSMITFLLLFSGSTSSLASF